MKIRNYLNTSHYLLIQISFEKEKMIENLIKELQKLFEQLDYFIKIDYCKNTETRKDENSIFYIEISYFEYPSIIFYIVFSIIIFTNLTMIGALFFLGILMLLRYSFTELIRKIISSVIIYIATDKMKSLNIDDFEIYSVKKGNKYIKKYFC